MRILVVSQHFYPEQFRINDLCFSLKERGHEVTVLTGLPNYPKGKVLKEYRWFKNRKQNINGVKIIRCNLIGRGTSTIKLALNYLWFAFFGSLKALTIKKDFDIIYVFQTSPVTMAWPAITVKKTAKIPLIIHCLDQWPISVTTGTIKEKSFIYKILYKISRWTYNKADLITISSKSFKKYFENILKINKEIIYTPSYAENDFDGIELTKNDTFDLVFAGNIGPAQSVETIVEAANILKDNKKIKFHIVGDGLNKKSCEEMAKNYNLNNVIFYDFRPVNELKDLYSLADAFLITMVDNEVVNSTLPAKVQSYMLAKKPIIGAINGEVKEVIKEAECGLCCNSLDYKEFSKIILEMSNSTEEQLKLWANNAYNYYKNNFEKEKCISDLEKIFDEHRKKAASK